MYPKCTYKKGDKADGRMRAASKRRGVEVTSISRPIRPSDFTEFDLILAMDRQNEGTFVYLFGLTSSAPPPNPPTHT
jgi:protein-tyrosine phosphatase